MILIYGNPETVACQATHLKVVQLQSKKLFEKVVQNAVRANTESEKKKKGLKVI